MTLYRYFLEAQSKRYLNRFFDQEYQLTEPKHDVYSSFLFDKEINDMNKFIIGLPEQYYQIKDNINMNSIFFSLIAEYTKSGLRDMQQAIKLLQAINLTYNEKLYSFLIIFLCLRSFELTNILQCNIFFRFRALATTLAASSGNKVKG